MNLSIFLFFAYVISLHIPTTQTLSISGYGIKDLEGIDSTSLQEEADWWNLTSSVSHAKITQTTNTFQWILGGPNILGGRDSANPLPAFFRTYTNLPPHSFVGISLEMWYFDLNDVTWYNNFTGITFEFDGLHTGTEGFSRFRIVELDNRIDGPLLRKNTDFITEDGGDNDKADLKRAYTKFGFLSESSELTLRIVFHDTQGRFLQSIGFRGLHIHLSNYSGPIPALCHRSQDLDSLSHQQCKCPINQARDSKGNCVSCAANCDVCFGPAAEECLACSAGAYWDGSQCNTCHLMCETCTGTTSNECPSCKYGFYNYGNNTCMESCELPFVAENRGTELFCVPLCLASQFYWPLNQTCLNKCDFPLVHVPDENSIEFCLNPCEGTTKYLYANGSCLDSCKAPLILRKDLNIKFCVNPCPPTSYLFSNNGSCLSSCPFPLMSRSEPGAQYCSNPCPSASYFLFNNGSCEKTCPAPLISRFESGVKYCYTPCNSVDEFIYDNRTCGDSCSLPLVSRTEPLVARYCSNPCLVSSNFFLYPNGSCFAGCSWPLKNKTEPGAKYCYSSCSSSSEYIYPDGSCDNKCPSPLMARAESDFNYCLSPCSDSSQYLYSDQSCQSTCKSPLIKRLDKSGIKHCDTPCDESEYVYQDGTCRPKCGYPFRVLSNSAYKICSMNLDEIQKGQAHSLARGTDIANTVCGIGGLLTGFVTPGDPTSMLMWSLLKMLQFTKYMDVNFPGQMTLIFTRQNENYNGDGDMSNTGRILNSHDRDLGKFTSYGVPQSFLENYWQQLIIFAVLIILIAILWLLSKLIKNPEYLRICMNLKSALQWNVLLMFFCGSYGELVLYSAIEFQTVSFESTGSMMSFVICLFMVTLAVYLPIKIAYVLKVIRDAKSAFGEKDAEKQWSHNRVFFEAYKSDQFIQHIFLFIYLIRVALFNIIIGYIFKSALAQALLINLLSFGMLAYLLLKTPIKDKFCFYQQVLMESMLFVYNLCILILVILDLAGVEVESTRAFFGGIMVVALIVGPVGMAVLIISKLFFRLRDLYDQFRAQKEIEKRVKSAFRFKKAQNNGSFTIGNDETLNLSHSGINGVKPADESHLVVIPNEKEEVSPWYSIPIKKNKLAPQKGGSKNLHLQKNFVESLIVEIYAKKESNSKSRKVSVFKNDDYLPD